MRTDAADVKRLLSPIGFGAMTFGDQVGRDEARRMVHTCLDAGVTHFDTANSYTGGASEELLGEVLRDRRDEVVLATKAGNPHGDGPAYAGLSRQSLKLALADSLRRLGTDHVDLYYFHLPDGQTPLEESLAAGQELVDGGDVRAIAVSNYPAWEICRQLWIADANGYQPVVGAQMMFSLLARRIEDEYAGLADTFDLATIVYNPLAGGLLTGKHRRPAPGDTVESGRFANRRYRDRYWKDELFTAVEELSGIAAEAGTDLRDLALRWVRSRPLVTSVLVGASSHDQLEANLRSLRAPRLSADVLERCDEVWEWIRGSAPRYDKTRMASRS